MKFIYTKNHKGQLTGVCAAEWFAVAANRALFLSPGDTHSSFEAPADTTYKQLKQLAKEHCERDERAFANLLRVAALDASDGVLHVNDVRALGGTYEELVANLYRIADAGLTIRIRRKPSGEGG